MFYRPTRVTINLDALSGNLAAVRELAGQGRKVCAVIKANAYGMGAEKLAHHLEEQGCDCFGVATLKEAAELRRSGIKRPIILLGALYGRHSIWEAMLLDLEISIHHLAGLADVEHLDAAERKRLKLHLKVNTGMGRLGLQPDEVGTICEKARELGITFKGVFTTFSSSDRKDNPLNQQQLTRFQNIIAEMMAHDFDPELKHIANSGAVLNLPEALQTMVRPGLLLHGLPPYPAPSPEGFRPISSLQSEIIQISDHPSGTSIGYSAAFVTKRPTRAAIIPIGYADGLNRLLSNRGTVLIHGKRVPIIGKISMDLTILDITDVEGVNLGDPVTIIGRDGDEEITAWEMAETIGSIPWEIFCWIGPRVPRIYVRDDETEV